MAEKISWLRQDCSWDTNTVIAIHSSMKIFRLVALL